MNMVVIGSIEAASCTRTRHRLRFSMYSLVDRPARLNPRRPQ